MKTKALARLRDAWHWLTEVPGWPDASHAMRLRRALPILVPCAAMLGLLLWNLAVRDPAVRRERAAHQPLLALEREIEALRAGCSDQQAVESAARATETAERLLAGADATGTQLRQLKAAAGELGWEGNFVANDTSLDAPAAGAELVFLPVRARLAPAAENTRQLPSLLALLDRLPATGKRIELTRLAVHADEAGRYAVELNLRLAARPPAP